MSSELIQPTLFELPASVIEQMNLEGRYTAERLLRDRPEIYQAIVALLSEGQSIRAIKRVCRVHHETIGAVATLERIAIDTGKERVCATLRLAQAALADSMLEDIMEGRLKPNEKAIPLGIITDKLEQLSGGATIRVEITHSTQQPKTWEEWLEKMKPAGMGLSGETPDQRAPIEVRTHALPAPTLPPQSSTSDPVSDAQLAKSDSVPDSVPDSEVCEADPIPPDPSTWGAGGVATEVGGRAGSTG